MATKFIDFVQQQDAVAFKESFEAAVSEKVFTVLEAKKQEIAQSFFTEKKHVCPECGKAKCMCESESSERMGDPLAHSELAHHVANASATAAAAEHHKINFHAHIGKHTEAMAHGDHHAAHHHMEKAKMHAKAHHELTGHPIHEEMENHLGIGGHHGGGFTGKGTPHSGHPSKGWPKAPAAGSAHDTGSKEHPAKHGEKVQTKFQKHHTDSAAHMDAVHADLSKHHHQHHMEEGHDKHEKKHAKLHHKMTKKMMKLAHKHSKKHHEEEE